MANRKFYLRGFLDAVIEVLAATLLWSVAVSVSYIFFFPVRVSFYIWCGSLPVLFLAISVKKFFEGSDPY